MSSLRSTAHCVATLVQVDARKAFDFLADGMNQTYWALGSWDRREVGERTFVGTSLFDGRELFVRLVPDEERPHDARRRPTPPRHYAPSDTKGTKDSCAS